MVSIVGPHDEFLRTLEAHLDADVHVRGNEVTFTGSAEAVTRAADVLTELITIVRTGQGLTADAVERVVGRPGRRRFEQAGGLAVVAGDRHQAEHGGHGVDTRLEGDAVGAELPGPTR